MKITHSPRLFPMMMLCLTLALVVAVQGGCTRLRKSQIVPITGASTVALDGTSPLALDIDNQRGSVQVEVSPKFKAPIIWAGVPGETKTARRPDFVAAQLVMDSGRPVLRILSASPSSTSPGSAAGEPKYVNLRIQVPSCAGIRIRNDGGPVFLKGVAGAIDIINSTHGMAGGTTVIAAKPITDPITIKASRGGIDLRLQEGSEGTLNARTMKGSMRIDVDKARVIGAKTSYREWIGTLNKPGNPIDLRAEEGDVVVMYGRK